MSVISRKTSQSKDYGTALFVLKYVLVSLVITAIFFAVVAVIYIFVDIPVNVLEIITLVVSIAVSLIVSCLVGKESGTAVAGGVVVLFFALLRIVISMVLGFTPILSLRTPFELVTGFLIGIIGGIFGCGGTKRRLRRYR